MSDLIRREDAIAIVKEKCDGDAGFDYGQYDAITALYQLPSIQPEPTLEQIEEYCYKQGLSIVDNALLHKYAQVEQKKGKWIEEAKTCRKLCKEKGLFNESSFFGDDMGGVE